MDTIELDRVLKLGAPERLDLMGRLWDSLVDDGLVPTLSTPQRSELDRRLDRLDRDGAGDLSWSDARQKIERGEGIE